VREVLLEHQEMPVQGETEDQLVLLASLVNRAQEESVVSQDSLVLLDVPALLAHKVGH